MSQYLPRASVYDSGSKEGLSVETVAISRNFIFNSYLINIKKSDKIVKTVIICNSSAGKAV